MRMQSFRFMVLIVVAAVVAAVELRSTTSAAAEAPSASKDVAFATSVVIAQGAEQVNSGRAVVQAAAPGKVDIAWADKDGAVRYTLIDLAQRGRNDGKVVDGELVCGLTHHLLGIGRDTKGVVRFGANNSKKVIEWTRGEDGKWAANDTGILCAQYYGPVAAYGVGGNGLGAFYAISDKKQAMLAQRNAMGAWNIQALSSNLPENIRGSLTVLRDGTPVVAFQTLDKPMSVSAGRADALVTATTNCHVWFPLAITADAKDRLHLIVALHSGLIQCLRSEDGGKTFAAVGAVAKSSTWGDAAHISAAASPDGSRLAACIPTGRLGLLLATSQDQGATWTTQELPGGKTQQAAPAFDRDGDLYVVYFNSDDHSLRLLSTRGGAASKPAR